MFHTAPSQPLQLQQQGQSSSDTAATASLLIHNNNSSGSLDLQLIYDVFHVSGNLFENDKQEIALSLYASCVSYCKDCTAQQAQLVARELQHGIATLNELPTASRISSSATIINPSNEDELPDMYHEDECDVGPRHFKRPLFPDMSLFQSHPQISATKSTLLLEYLDLLLLFNKGIQQHSLSEYGETLRLYEVVTHSLSKLLLQQEVSSPASMVLRHKLLELQMRVQNNMGHITYMLGLEDTSASHFRAAFCCWNSQGGVEQVASTMVVDAPLLRLEYAVVVSNWCRVHWMSGDIHDEVYQGLEEVLRIRASILKWDHMDVASAHYNLGMAEYARGHCEAALAHLFTYLKVAASKKAELSCKRNIVKQGDNEEDDAEAKKQEWLNSLDPIPALIYILLIKNEPKEDEISQELVRGLRSLQEKRACVGPQGPEIASVLNFIGTLLFHQRDNEHALLFFQEELRLEENLVFHQDDVSISVTCNNIGRILQELNRLPEAKHYYYRALKGYYGDRVEEWCALPKAQDACPLLWNISSLKDLPQSTMQLYSAVWYNLGLIHDKLGCYREATNAFQVSLGLRRTLLGPNHADVACLLYNIGVLQMEQKLLDEATGSFQEALRIRQNSPSTGHLNDGHVVLTLKKLASLHKANGNIGGALETLFEIVKLQKNPSSDATTIVAPTAAPAPESNVVQNIVTANSTTKDLGVTFREIAELYHAQGHVSMAITMAQKSTGILRDIEVAAAGTQEFVVNTEELVAGLLLLGSLYHEDCEPDMARQLFAEASSMIARVSTYFPTSTALDAMQEVTQILAACHCASQA